MIAAALRRVSATFMPVSKWLSYYVGARALTYMASPSVFSPAAVPAEIASLNQELEAAALRTPPLSAGTPQAAREARAKLFKHEPRRVDETIPGLDDSAPPVGISIFMPAGGMARATYLHYHGGGFIFGSAYGQSDPRLQRLADEHQLAVVSVDYRLAPEAQWPLPADDCVAAALWLVRHGGARFGTEVRLIGGESAGAHLCLCALLRLRDEHAAELGAPPAALFRAVNLVCAPPGAPKPRVHSNTLLADERARPWPPARQPSRPCPRPADGWYDLGGTPSMRSGWPARLVLCRDDLDWMAAKLVPDDATRAARAGPEAGGAAPLYSPLHGLPAALFTVGTHDPLRDDTLFLHARWVAHGLPAELEVYPGAAHGVGHFGPHEHTPQGRDINGRVGRFLSRAAAC